MDLRPGCNGEASHNGDIRLRDDAFGQLVYTEGHGKEHVGVSVVRAFPLTDPCHGIAICDAQGNELLWIDDLETLPGPIREKMEQHLARRHFLPTIQRIVCVSSPVEPSEWTIETDRGTTRFALTSEEDIRRLGECGALIVDAQAIHYLIPDLGLLDATSRRLLERYL